MRQPADKYKPRDGTEGDDEYKFDIFTGFPIEGSAAGKMLWFILDPGGKNMDP